MSQLPSGTVTFLFTDIEGSTERWEHDRQGMAAAVERHIALLDAAIHAHGGVHFKTMGDALQAAFPTAPQAVAAALAGQQGLLAEDWGEIGPLRVRMALHAGEAIPDDRGDYLAAPLNRLSRLLSSGYGGQILLSQTVQQLTRGALPAGAELRDLGEHRLRDLLEPERVYQLLHPDLAATFQTLRTLASRPNNLPLQPTPFLGREQEVMRVVDIVRSPEVRFLTLTGPGGTGKSRLALQAAAELLENFADGVFFVPLAALCDPNLVPSAMAATLGIREEGGQPLRERLRDVLATKQLLLVLDNLEHLVDAAPFVGELLTSAPDLKVLVTSRVPLHLRAEREYPVPPLGLPRRKPPPTAEQLSQFEAVRLFIERAQAVNPAFTIDNENAPAVAEICHRLDGLPLAIELAAARVRVLPPEAMLVRLEQRLPFLTGGARDAPERQRTLRNAIAWSYDLLGSHEQALFQRLAVFVGGCTLEAAEAVTNADGTLDVFGGLEGLVEHSLLRQETGPGGEPRFAMLETIREYGRERLGQSGEEAEMRRAHAAFFLALVEAAEAPLLGPQQLIWLDRLEAEHDNLRAALEETAEGGRPSEFLAFAVHCWRFWWPRGYWTEARMWLERANAQGEDVPTSDRAEALRALGLIADATGDQLRGRALLEESRKRFQDLGDRHGEWKTLLDLSLHWASRDYSEAGQYAERALAVARASGDPVMVARSLNRLGNWQLNREAPREAIARHQEALHLLEGLGDDQGIAETLDLLGIATTLGADFKGATGWYARAVPLWRQIGDRQGLVASLAGYAVLAHSFHGDTVPAALSPAEVRALGEESLILSREIGWRAGESIALWGYRGNVLGAWGDYSTALPGTREGLEIAGDIDHPQWITGARYVLALLYADLGDFSAASDELRGSLGLALEIDSPYWIRCCAGRLVSTLAAGRNLPEAAAVLDAYWQNAIPMDTLAGRNVWAGAADLALVTDDPNRALEIADRLVQAAGNGANRAIPRLELLRGQALTVLGRPAEADQALQVASDAAVWCGARPLLWRILAVRGRLAEAQGRAEVAKQAVAAAQSLIAELASALPDEALRAHFLKYASRETLHRPAQ